MNGTVPFLLFLGQVNLFSSSHGTENGILLLKCPSVPFRELSFSFFWGKSGLFLRRGWIKQMALGRALNSS